jgi:hypothetical protein
MSLKTKEGTAPPEVYYLSDSQNNVAHWTKMIKNDCKGNYGASGKAICNGTAQHIPEPPSKSATDDDEETYVYEHLPNSPALTDQGNREFNADKALFRSEEKIRKDEDTALFRHILDTLSADANRLIEMHSDYAEFLTLPDGNQAVAFFHLAIAAHSAGDMLTKYSRFIQWVTLQHQPGNSILATLEAVNTGGDEFFNNFCDEDGRVDPQLIVSMISLACLPSEFQQLLQNIFFTNDPALFLQPRKIQTQILSYATSHASQKRDPVSSQGQAYAAAVPPSEAPYCIYCFKRTGNKFLNHGTLGTPPCRRGKAPPTVTFDTQPSQSYMAALPATLPASVPMNPYLAYPPHAPTPFGLQQSPTTFPQQYFVPASIPQQPSSIQPPAQSLNPQVTATLRSFLANLEQGGSTETTTSLLAELYDHMAGV